MTAFPVPRNLSGSFVQFRYNFFVGTILLFLPFENLKEYFPPFCISSNLVKKVKFPLKILIIGNVNRLYFAHNIHIVLNILCPFFKIIQCFLNVMIHLLSL